MGGPEIIGVKGIKLPCTDLRASVRWYIEVLGAEPFLEFPDAEDGVVRGVALRFPGGDATLALRESPAHAQGLSGFNNVVWRVRDRAAVESWIDRLDRAGVPHSPLIEATLGFMVVFSDPDGIELHLYSDEEHATDHSDQGGYGRPTTAAAWTDEAVR